MLKQYIIRLDDACPQMNHENWQRIESLLDRYNVKPIVGIIPDNHDPEFNWPVDENFWDRACAWQKKGWTIAQHGYQHVYLNPKPKCKYFQLSHSIHTEWAGRDINQQRDMMRKGNHILREHGLIPTCFFAPAHTYDAATVAACCVTEGFQFISDGYGLRPYRKDEMTFLPSICDGPFSMPLSGVYTFVMHPSLMDSKAFLRWEKFLSNYAFECITPNIVLDQTINILPQGIIGSALEGGIFSIRGIRGWMK